MNEPAPQKQRRLALIIAVVAAGLAIWGVASRIYAHVQLRERTEAEAIPTVQVQTVAPAQASDQLVLPGDVQAWSDAPVYARTNGYLKRWVGDIGAKVKQGDLLAEIDAPEVDQQLAQAQAELAQAQANEELARSTAERWQGLLASDSVSKQEADEKQGDYQAKKALTASARANLQRLRDTQGFQKLVAPFDGTVTARNVDTGQLVGAGNAELFHVADTRRLRVYAQVPQSYAQATRVGMGAQLSFADAPGKTYPATIVRTADALDPATRTLRVQLELDNAQGELLPGSYAEVHFKLGAPAQTMRLPASAPMFRGQGLQVAVVDAQNTVHVKPITVGRDFGTEVEVL
ncbi:MAG TPA: efflux RND transporter periplasmic adaptor subunit, partial [Nevskiaceae bacterium]|nr:efflux RND transporter periplasmic adaptor subunit [Nevskiaceae bacterium]